MEIQQNSLSKYLDLYERVKARVGNEEVAVVLVQEIGKDGRVERMRSGASVKAYTRLDANGDQPASRKQVGYLKVLNVKVPEGVTKQQASELIDQHAV